MRAVHTLVPLLLFVSASTLDAQDLTELPATKPPKLFLGGGLVVAQPQQDFANHVGTSFGGNLNLLWKPLPGSPIAFRVEGGGIGYGNEEKRLRLGRVTLDMNTNNVIGFLHAGPQLMVPYGPIQPYIAPTAGFTYIATVSSLSGDDSESFASDTNYDDFLFSYGATGGVNIPVSRGRVPVALDLSARYYRNGKASYLVEGSIQDTPDGISYTPIRSNTNLLTFQMGVSVGIVVDENKKGSDNDD